MSTPQITQPAPPPRTPARKPSRPDLSSTTTPLGGRMKTSDPHARAATVSLSPPKPAKASPSRGLTLQIADNMSQYSRAKSIQSAPVRAVRRLPAPPLPAPPVTAIQEAPSTSFPFSVSNSPSPPRARRPLPKPPVAVQVGSEPIPENAPAGLTPTPRQRPLPIPIPKAEASSSSQASTSKLASKSLPSSPRDRPARPPIPSPSVIATFPRLDSTPPTKRHHHSASVKIPKATAGATRKPLHASRSHADLNIDVVQLHRQLVLNRKPARISIDSDATSDDESSEDTFSSAMVFRDAPGSQQEMRAAVHEAADEKSSHADYAWVLTNRILYPQSPAEGQKTSKWTREKNGKRYTEEDFSNIIRILRSL